MSTRRHARRRPESCKVGLEALSLGQGKPGHRFNGAGRNNLINDTAVYKDKRLSLSRAMIFYFISKA